MGCVSLVDVVGVSLLMRGTRFTGLSRHSTVFVSPVPAHPDALVLPTFAADTAVRVGGIGAMPEVFPTGCRQCGLELLGPFVVGLSQSPHLVGGQAEVT